MEFQQIISKLTSVSQSGKCNYPTNFNTLLTTKERKYLVTQILNTSYKDLQKVINITDKLNQFIEDSIFLASEESEILMHYTYKWKRKTINKLQQRLTARQLNTVINETEKHIKEKGITSKVYSYDTMRKVLLIRYTESELRELLIKYGEALKTQSCLSNFGRKRAGGNRSIEHMRKMSEKSRQKLANLSESDRAAYLKRKSDAAKIANAKITPEQRLLINEKNRISNIKHWQNLPEAEKERRRCQATKHALEAIAKMPAMSSHSSRNDSFEQLLKSITSYKIEREFPIYYNDNHLFRYDFKINNLLIDINPVETHNSSISFNKLRNLPESESDRIPSNYHHMRWKIARNNGYELISIFDWMQNSKLSEFLAFKLSNNLPTVGARKCEVKQVTQRDAIQFINTHHMLGCAYVSNTINLGLYYENQLVSVATFCKPRYSKDVKYDYELLRFVSSVRVLGGLNKLWDTFIRTYRPNTVITYTDNNIGNGFIYKSIGFDELSIEPAACYWQHTRYPEYKFQAQTLAKRGADAIIKFYVENKFGREYFYVGNDFEDYKRRGGMEFYGRPNDTSNNWLSNNDIALFYGFVKIFDCGNTRWLWSSK